MKNYFEILKTYIAENPPDFGDGDSVLTLLYEAYAESNRMDDGTIKEDFNELYRQMNGMELREMTNIFDILKKNYKLIEGVGESGGYHAQVLMSSLFSQMDFR